ncbi:hypothetical protein CLU99_1499 [Flavobacterium sp. 2]|nr:hypothetical protein CLU99_1499 [Flavobacterium sp. 2]
MFLTDSPEASGSLRLTIHKVNYVKEMYFLLCALFTIKIYSEASGLCVKKNESQRTKNNKQ